jgi:hypothetical protein
LAQAIQEEAAFADSYQADIWELLHVRCLLSFVSTGCCLVEAVRCLLPAV